MNREELKKKIAQIIADYFCPQGNEHKKLWGDDRLCYSKMNFAECEWIAECTDALIAAGIGDVRELKKHRVVVEKSLIPEDDNAYVLPNIPPTVKQLYSGEEVEQIVIERAEYKHRAQVAEKAFSNCIENFVKFQYEQKSIQLDNVFLDEVIKKCLQQAEKELAEEEKDEN